MVAKTEIDRGAKTILGIAVLLIIAVIGLSVYKAFIGEQSISQIFVFGFLALIAFGLIRAGIYAGARTLDMENFILLLILIGAPVAVLFLLPKAGINLFSTFGISAGLNVDLDLTGNVIEWIKNNLLIFGIILIALFILRKNIAKTIRKIFR